MKLPASFFVLRTAQLAVKAVPTFVRFAVMAAVAWVPRRRASAKRGRASISLTLASTTPYSSTTGASRVGGHIARSSLTSYSKVCRKRIAVRG